MHIIDSDKESDKNCVDREATGMSRVQTDSEEDYDDVDQVEALEQIDFQLPRDRLPPEVLTPEWLDTSELEGISHLPSEGWSHISRNACTIYVISKYFSS